MILSLSTVVSGQNVTSMKSSEVEIGQNHNNPTVYSNYLTYHRCEEAGIQASKDSPEREIVIKQVETNETRILETEISCDSFLSLHLSEEYLFYSGGNSLHYADLGSLSRRKLLNHSSYAISDGSVINWKDSTYLKTPEIEPKDFSLSEIKVFEYDRKESEYFRPVDDWNGDIIVYFTGDAIFYNKNKQEYIGADYRRVGRGASCKVLKAQTDEAYYLNERCSTGHGNLIKLESGDIFNISSEEVITPEDVKGCNEAISDTGTWGMNESGDSEARANSEGRYASPPCHYSFKRNEEIIGSVKPKGNLVSVSDNIMWREITDRILQRIKLTQKDAGKLCSSLEVNKNISCSYQKTKLDHCTCNVSQYNGTNVIERSFSFILPGLYEQGAIERMSSFQQTVEPDSEKSEDRGLGGITGVAILVLGSIMLLLIGVATGASPRNKYVCENCGHIWRTRKDEGEPPYCPRCNSRDLHKK
jgi:DNA-directed RNA polymerase subunit RPC12/RpoP